uniref:FGFR1 oncogene partner 2 homolog n=1 Tax=Styela clava TaxID=7725 RepID=UPI00193AC74A|nr:FGFR1 oncogene partner 2 homolog [Styela clava]
MNITIESLLADAKYLVTRLKDHDSAAESLAEQASTLKKEMEARNTYQENLIELNKVAGHRPRSTLVLGIQQENNAIRSLQHENDELRQSLTDHQNALELIMTKYRQQMMKFTKHQNIQITENAYQAEKQYQEENMELIDKIHEMAAVMRHAADVDDEQYIRDYEELSRLQTENDILREMLMISKSSFGSRLITTEQKDSGKTDKPEIESEMVLADDTTSDKTVIHEGESP